MSHAKTFILLGIFTVNFLFSENNSNCNPKCPPQKCEPAVCKPKPKCPPVKCEPVKCKEEEKPECEVPKAPDSSAYVAPGRINVCTTWDFNLSASFIYWEPREKGLELGIPFNNTNMDFNKSELQNMDFTYKMGFKAALGFNFENDNWTSLFEYTRFHMTHNSKSTRPDWADRFNAIWFSNAEDNTTEIKGRWKLNLDIIDFRIARPSYFGEKFILTPLFGGKGGWIDQNYRSTILYNGSYVQNNLKSRSWLIGPRAGIDSKWLLGSAFRINGDFAFSLFYQYFRSITMKRQNINAPDSLEANVLNKKGYVNPAIETAVGLGWGSYFSRNKYHFDLLANYEFQFYFNQNMMRSLKDNYDAKSDSSPGDLMFHGLTVTMKFDF
ncbi:MAG: hypothetical protein JXA94_05980 [Parachlamydiales bacterium]|nr:hypothetical protein [Parachlamydiales bacterium]